MAFSSSATRVDSMVGWSTGRDLRDRRIEMKSGSAWERLPFRAWWVARAVVTDRTFEETGPALGLMRPERSKRLSGLGVDEDAMSNAHLYMSAAASGVPL